MPVTFAQKLASIPGYSAGAPAGVAPESVVAGDLAQLASNESAHPPHPAVVEAIARAAAAINRYPDPSAALMRGRIAERFGLEPSRVAVSNGSCEILLAAAMALCEPGAEVVFAWPSFSMYPFLAPLSGAREIRVPLDTSDGHDLEAMAAEVTAATQLVLVCNPNNPTGAALRAERIGAFVSGLPSHVTVIVDEAYVEFQTLDDPDASVDLLKCHNNLVLLRTFSKCYGLAGVRAGYALCSPGFRAAVDAVRQPFSINALAQAAAAEAILHQDDVVARVEKNLVERIWVESELESLADRGLEATPSQANFSWISLGEALEPELVETLADAGVLVRPGTPLGGPGHVRVTYGTRPQNERFVVALAAALSRG